MKTISSIVLFCLLAPALSRAQSPVQWNFSAKALGNHRYELHLTATVGSSWHIYSASTPPGGPVPTTFSFRANPVVKLEGELAEAGKMITKKEEVFGVEVKYFNDRVDFVQTVTSKTKTTMSGRVRYMVCNDRECLPPNTVDFSIALQ